MQPIAHYLDAASKACGASSDRELGRRLGLSQAAISQWRTGRSVPSDDCMLALCTLAGLDPTQGIIDAGHARAAAAGSAPVAAIYASLAAQIGKTAAAFLLALSLSTAEAAGPNTTGTNAAMPSKSIHYAKLLLRKLVLIFTHWQRVMA